MSVNPISGPQTKSTEIKKPENKNTVSKCVSKLSIRDGVIITAVPTVIGAGYAAKTYFERKGKFSVYSDLVKKFAEGTAEHVNFKDCANIMKKSMREARICGILVAAAGILAAGIFAITKSLKSNKKGIPDSKPAENNKPKEQIKIDKEKTDVK